MEMTKRKKERRKISDLTVGDVVFCLDRYTHELHIENIIKQDLWEGRYFLSGPKCYTNPEINCTNTEKSNIANHGDIVFSNKEAVIDYIKDTSKKLKDIRLYLRKRKFK